jgi:large subunit ribosomal protein L25
MSSFQLQAEKREQLGSLEARRIKKAGKIPAVIYSKNGNLNVSIDQRQFSQEYLKGNVQTRIAEIELAGKKIKTITHKVELDPVSDQPIHVELINCDEAHAIKAQPKLKFINQDKAPGLKKGGVLHIVLRKIEVFCENAANIPATIDVDTGSMQVGSKVRSNNLKLPAGVKLQRKDNFLIASIIGRGKAEEEAAATPGADAAGAAGTAAPAAGAATPAAGAAKAPAAGDKKPADKK